MSDYKKYDVVTKKTLFDALKENDSEIKRKISYLEKFEDSGYLNDFETLKATVELLKEAEELERLLKNRFEFLVQKIRDKNFEFESYLSMMHRQGSPNQDDEETEQQQEE